ncbi:MAG: leucine-rich repeat domain-containing protein, partial [Ruminococcus sp.]|nr:leucine-rich repeat domain-containing protein [Ruminococcus sp.]
LETLRCNSNQLTTLDISKNTALEWLECFNNQLTALDVSKNTALTKLYCNSNQLTSLDVSNNTELTKLYCSNNTYKISLTDGKFDLSTLPAGFDIAKAFEWTNGTVESNILTFDDDTMPVFYAYDSGNDQTAFFRLVTENFVDELLFPPTDEPTLPLGDINGNNIVDSSDASNVLAVYALVSTGKESGLTAEQKTAADVNGDGKYDSIDASLILAYYSHIQTGGTGTIEDYLKS